MSKDLTISSEDVSIAELDVPRLALIALTFSLSSTRQAGSGGAVASAVGATRVLLGNSKSLESVDARPRLDVER